MPVHSCHLCNQNENSRQMMAGRGLADGEVCPVCYQPTCRNHLGTVRWRWRSNRQVDSALICQDCLRSYKHRDWDKYNRDWIT